MTRASFEVNGQPVEVDGADETLLVHFLRNQLQLKATRYGCGQEHCGACLVLVDEEPRYACQTEVGHLDGRSVKTWEGLSQTDAGQAMAAAVERRQAAQCAFCLSGVMVRAYACVLEGRDDPRDVRQCLKPQLCRCGAHVRMIAAVRDAATAVRDDA